MSNSVFDLRQKLAAEFTGTGFLVGTVVGSGIMAERLSDGNVGLALFANGVATGAILVVLIIMFAPISGAHLNPAVSLVMRLNGTLGTSEFFACASKDAAFFNARLLTVSVPLPSRPLIMSRRSKASMRRHKSAPAKYISAFLMRFQLSFSSSVPSAGVRTTRPSTLRAQASPSPRCSLREPIN